MAEGKAGAPIGNQNAKKTKPWADALRRALARRGNGDLRVGIDKLAEKLLEDCEKGNLTALQELGNRLDGKPAQAITGEDGGPIELDTRINASGLTTDQLRALASIAVHGS